jgi:hypothetical protein
MVKNITGGTRHKSIARKHVSPSNNNNNNINKLRTPQNEHELFAIVTHYYGNGICKIITHNNLSLYAHIRKKFSGRHKRYNLIHTHSIILVGIRHWENPFKNTDLLHVFNPNITQSIIQLFHFTLFQTIINNSESGLDNMIEYADDSGITIEPDVKPMRIEDLEDEEDEIDIDEI